MGRLENKVALITGASNGMGAVHVERFVAEGAKVIAADIDVENGRALVDRLGDAVLFVELDVTDKQAWQDAVKAGVEAFGPITVLVNNAGVAGQTVKTLDIDEKEYTRTIDIDLHGVFNGMRAVVPQMVEAGGGSVVNISSTAGMVAAPAVNVAYVAAKWAVRGMTKQLAVEYGPEKIRANSVHPGGIRTPLAQGLIDKLGPEWEKEFFSNVPLNRIGEMEEITNVVLFLASDESSYVTGMELVADGGQIQV